MVENWSKVPTKIWEICFWYIVAEISAMEKETCSVTKVFNKILIPFYNWNKWHKSRDYGPHNNSTLKRNLFQSQLGGARFIGRF